MRISVDPEDPGFTPRASYAHVFLDDKPLEDCITADEEKGEALVYRRDERGRLVVINNDHLQTETVKGRIRVVFETSGAGHG